MNEGGAWYERHCSGGRGLIDLTQKGTDELGVGQYAANPGGAPANLAVAAARLGASTAFVGKVGADAFGAYLRRVLEENRVDTRGMLPIPGSAPPWRWSAWTAPGSAASASTVTPART